MRRNQATFAGFLISSALLGSVSSAGAQQPEKTAEDYFLEGRSFADNRDLEGAHKAYMEGWRKKQGYDIAANIAVVELKRGKARDAAQYFAYWERFGPASPDDSERERRAKAQLLFAQARAKVGAVRIHLAASDGRSVEKADVLVDGARIERWVLDTNVVFVDPGGHSFVAQLSGCEDFAWQGNVQRGSSIDVSLTLKCPKKPSASAPRSFEAPPGAVEQAPLVSVGASHRPSWVSVGIGLGIAAAGIGVGVGSAIHSYNRRQDFDAGWTQLYDVGAESACADGANKALCDELAPAEKDARTFRGIAIAGFAVGASAAVVTTLITILRASPSKAPQGRRVIKASAAFLPGGGTTVLLGSF